MEAPMQSFGAPRRRTAVVGDNFGPYRAPLTEKVSMERSAGLEVHLSQKRLSLCTVLALEVLSAPKVPGRSSAALK